MKRVSTIVVLCFFALICMQGTNAYGQASTANYTFSTGVDGSLTDMTVSSTTLLAAGLDDIPGTVANIGFTFYFMGQAYSQFSINDNGNMRLGSTGIQGGTPYSIPNTTVPLLNPFGNDMRVGTDGRVAFKVVGSAPNRVLVVQWSKVMIRFLAPANPGTASFEARLYETSNTIEYVYGEMATNSATPATYTVGFSVNTTSTNVISVAVATHTASTVAPVTTNSYVANSTVADLHSTANGSRRWYRFAPSLTAPTTPGGPLSFTSVGLSAMTLNWTDSPDEAGYAIFRSTDGVSYTLFGNASKDAISFVATGLNPGTLYFWRVVAIAEAATSAPLSGSMATTSATLTGTRKVGPNESAPNYLTIAAALTDIAAMGLSGNLTLELKSDYAGEVGPITIGNLPGSGPSSVLTIRPEAGAPLLTITSAAAQTFDLNGARHVIIDGQPGGTGSTKGLVIENTSTTGVATRFINDAMNNIIRYCEFRGVNTATTGGVIVFSTTTGPNGNDNNTIDNCDVRDGATTPTNLILSSGTSASQAQNNSGNVISNCNIFNWFHATSTTRGIFLSTASTDWTITGNSFYQTASRAASANTVNAIDISNTSTGNNFVVSNNYIGGTAPLAAGSKMTFTGSGIIRLVLVSTNIGTVSTFHGNVIRNISITSSGTSTSQSCISHLNGSWNIGVGGGNTIGSSSVNGDITVSLTGASGTFSAMLLGTGTTGQGSTVVSNNSIGGIDVTGTASLTRGLSIQSSGAIPNISTYEVSNNTIGSTTVANSISNAGNQWIIGIMSFVGGSATIPNVPIIISNNTVANLTGTNAGTSGLAVGIQAQGAGTNPYFGKYTVTGNTIRNITNAAPVPVYGINFLPNTDLGQTASNNLIHTLASTNTAAATHNMVGIWFLSPTTGTNTVMRNRIYNISSSGTGVGAAAPAIVGIFASTGSVTYANNMVALGATAGNESSVFGLYDNSTGTNSWLFNSVALKGNTAGTTNTSYAFLRANTSTITLRNNILSNLRTGGAANIAVANGNAASTGWAADASNYNVLNAASTTQIGQWLSTGTPVSLADWRTASSGDANSVEKAVTFANDANDLHLAGSSLGDFDLKGVPFGGITTDFDNDARDSQAPTIGCDESVPPLPVQLASFGARINPNGAGVRLDWRTISELNNYGFYVQRKLDGEENFVELANSFVSGNGTTSQPHDYVYVDASIQRAGLYHYRLRQVDLDGSSNFTEPVTVTVSSVTGVNEEAPRVFALFQNYPNPFNPSTEIKFSVENSGRATLEIYNLLGQKVATLFDDIADAGRYYRVRVNAAGFASGMYIYKLQSGSRVDVRKMLLMK